jgi:hypothetical protein
LILTLLIASAAGCGASQGHVSGQVKYKDKPVPGGLVTFVPSDTTKRPVVTEIDENGHYKLYVPVGDAKIAVENLTLKQVELPAGGIPPPAGIKIPAAEKPAGEAKPSPSALKKPPGSYVPIPEKYYDSRNSGLSYVVVSGSQTHDIELTGEVSDGSTQKRKRGAK